MVEFKKSVFTDKFHPGVTQSSTAKSFGELNTFSLPDYLP